MALSDKSAWAQIFPSDLYAGIRYATSSFVMAELVMARDSLDCPIEEAVAFS